MPLFSLPKPFVPTMHVYEYALIRALPDVEREEFINVGLLLFCKRTRYITARIALDTAKWAAFRSNVELSALQAQLNALVRIAEGDPTGGPIAAYDPPERFRWLTAERSSALRTSRPHAGISADPPSTATALFEKLVC